MEAGAVPVLLDLLGHPEFAVQTYSSGLLQSLTYKNGGAALAIMQGGGLQRVLDLAVQAEEDSSLVSTLRCIVLHMAAYCEDDLTVKALAHAEGTLRILVGLLMGTCLTLPAENFDECKVEAARALGNLAARASFIRPQIIQSGAVEELESWTDSRVVSVDFKAAAAAVLKQLSN